MAKLLLISIVIMTIAIPMRASRDPSPTRGLRRAVLWFAGFNLLYLIGIIYVLPRLPA